ncbi:GNAT family N-acetyltransferase [Siccirubricoccus phaeus]|uniref:GNAT family N-acetyltransferase n=1 Tax=Siccirubricoccus phaeus TaxID=2595053 RepID=UPI0011F19F7A|nr:GNAT family N-acetyltransferase [Siccirubricoccus phaeus]
MPETPAPAAPPAVIRILGPEDAAAFRALRIEALRRHPEAFGASAEDAETLDAAAFARMLPRQPPDAIFGGFLGGALAGMAGFFIHRPPKVRHKGAIWGVYVRAEARGQGMALRLMQAAIAQARAAGVQRLLLTVGHANAPARRLYDRLGFLPYGVERDALRLPDGRSLDEELRALDLAG